MWWGISSEQRSFSPPIGVNLLSKLFSSEAQFQSWRPSGRQDWNWVFYKRRERDAEKTPTMASEKGGWS
jgi:hypothetical protein